MKLIKTLVPAALLFAATLTAQAQWFARTDILRVDVSWEGYDNATGVGFSGGRYFGKHDEHEVSLDIDYVKWDVDIHEGYLTVGGYEKYTPVLINYRYNAWGMDEFKNVKFYAGPSIGYTYSKFRYDVTGSGVRYSDGDSDWLFSWGGSAGFLVNVARNIELNFGYRYLHLDGGNYSIQNISYKSESGHAHIFYGGLSVRF